MEERIEIRLNGAIREVPLGLSVDRLLETLGLGQDRVAVEVNRRIVKREEWTATRIAPGDVVEVVHFVGGGA